MTAEVAYELQDKADFMVGSMDRIESAGYDPGVLVAEWSRCSDPKELANRLVQNRDSRQLESFCTLSAELGGMPRLKDALSDLSRELLELDSSQADALRSQLQLARRASPSPGFQDAFFNQGCSLVQNPDPVEVKEWVHEARPSDPISLVDLCRCLLESERPKLRESAQALLAVHQQVVFSQRDPECDGLSVLLPLPSTWFRRSRRRFCP